MAKFNQSNQDVHGNQYNADSIAIGAESADLVARIARLIEAVRREVGAEGLKVVDVLESAQAEASAGHVEKARRLLGTVKDLAASATATVGFVSAIAALIGPG